MYCMGLAGQNDPHLGYAADAQNHYWMLGSNFSVDVRWNRFRCLFIWNKRFWIY